MKRRIFEIAGFTPGDENVLVCCAKGAKDAARKISWLLENKPKVQKVVVYQFQSNTESISDIESSLALGEFGHAQAY
jgi:hypothetical protein